MEFASASGRSERFDGKTLVLPVCSTGNVGQLAADLLINTIKPQYLGQLLNPNVLSCFGSDAFVEASNTPTTELQVYGLGDSVFVQQRAPAALGREAAFAESTAEWVKASNFTQVILLGSIDSGIRHGAQLESSQLRFCTADEQLGSICHSLHYVKLEEGSKEGSCHEESLLPPWPLYRSLGLNGVPVVLLSAFVGEGEGNLRDAAELASYLFELLKALGRAPEGNLSAWKGPVSWCHLFGTQSHTTIY